MPYMSRKGTAVCEHCRQKFKQVRSDQRYCSGKCRTAAHRKKQDKPSSQ